MKTLIDTVNDRIATLQAELKKSKDALLGLQYLCEHDWRFVGHGHNETCYTCTICGKDKWE